MKFHFDSPAYYNLSIFRYVAKAEIEDSLTLSESPKCDRCGTLKSLPR